MVNIVLYPVSLIIVLNEIICESLNFQGLPINEKEMSVIIMFNCFTRIYKYLYTYICNGKKSKLFSFYFYSDADDSKCSINNEIKHIIFTNGFFHTICEEDRKRKKN